MGTKTGQNVEKKARKAHFRDPRKGRADHRRPCLRAAAPRPLPIERPRDGRNRLAPAGARPFRAGFVCDTEKQKETSFV